MIEIGAAEPLLQGKIRDAADLAGENAQAPCILAEGERLCGQDCKRGGK
jgi:hypothetical protein